MATVAQIQGAINLSITGSTAFCGACRIIAGPLFTQSPTQDEYVVKGGADGTFGRAHRRICITNRADVAVIQAADILTQMRSS